MTQLDPLTKWIMRVTITITSSLITYFIIGSLLSLLSVDSEWWVLGIAFAVYPATMGSFDSIVNWLTLMQKHNVDILIAETLLWFSVGWFVYLSVPFIIFRGLKKRGL